MAATHETHATLLEQARAAVDGPGDHLAWHDDDGALHVVRLARQWTRIGRSLAADIRFDDPSVLRRHALLVRDPDAVRAWTGTGWHELRDGDRLQVGRHTLVFVRH